ncbi:MAG: ABC transporter ATP-binding protein, partial [Armatimonadetes bacterium]|nr:ABC transporter ATP-binding protein [Armatimonadota bacterium]
MTVSGASLRAEGIGFTYRGADRPALCGVDLDLPPGHFAYLMGRTGAGKSTLCLCLNGIIPTMQAGDFAGRVLIADEDIAGRGVYETAQRVGILFQAFETQLLCSDVESEVAFGLENAQVPRDRMRRRVDEMLTLVGLEELRGRDPADLSGGQKQRLALAAVLAPAPAALILDEPTTDLDPRGKRDLMEIIARLRADGVTLLVADHETEDALAADTLVALVEGETAYAGPPEELLRDPQRSRELGIRPLEMPELFARLGRPERPLTPEAAAEILQADGDGERPAEHRPAPHNDGNILIEVD